MKKRYGTVAIVLAVGCLGGCGKVLGSLAKGAVHEADNVATTAARSATSEEAQLAASAAAHSADDALHGPKPGEEAASETPVSDFMAGSAKKFVEDLPQSVVQEGLESALSDDDERQ